MLNPGEFIHIKGKLQERYKQPDSIEFKISTMQLLSDLRDKMLKAITLKISVDKVNQNWIEELSGLINTAEVTGPANCTLKFKIYDPKDSSLNVELPCKKIRINPQNELIQSLEKLAEVEF